MTSTAGFPAWRFVKHHPEAKSRDPLQSELLNQESFKPADALVRESIQNSLDARHPDSKKVNVRIYVSGEAGALSADEAAPYFEGFWPHIAECENGGQVTSNLSTGQCRFVVIEDFGTIGLTGDPAATRVAAGVPNNYYYFLRAEGISGKEAGNLGRWGVGKYVFPKTSGVNTFLALTNRSDDPGNSLLVGQTVLMNHTLNGIDYDPDGWWAEPGEGVQMPITDPLIIAEAAKRWKVSRTDEPGLSIVIPYVDAELGGTDFVRAVIRAYFGAILAGGLLVDVIDAGDLGTIRLNAENVLDLAESFFDGNEREKVVSEIQLLAARHSIPGDCRFSTNPIAGQPGRGWSSSVIDTETAVQIRAQLQTGQPVEVAVPIELQLKDQPGEPTHTLFYVLLQHDETLRQKPLFLRRGIVISEASRFNLPGIRAICIVDDDPLTKMLGDAENPAHTTWTANDKIKARYVRGADTLALIKQAPHKIYQLILDAGLEEQRIVFSDIFAVPIKNTEAAKKSPGSSRKPNAKGRRSTSPGGGGGQRAQPLTSLEREDAGGFSIVPTEYGRAGNLKRLEVAVGYTTRRGDALARWSKDDFDLSNLPSTITGGEIEKSSGNTLTVAVTDASDFKLKVLGFDVNRDLTIRARGYSK